MRNTTHPCHLLAFTEQISCFEWCSNDFAYNLICVASDKKLILGQIQLPDESETNTFYYERIKDIYHESRCHAICFAPNTSLIAMPKTVTFCAAGADFLLRIFRTDLQSSDTVQVLKGHTNYINNAAWSYHDGEYLASVSDDHSCKIWSAKTNFEDVTTFCLSSPGMTVKWHPEELNKILVAEKRGAIHLYNVRSQQAILSVETTKYPLMAADWAQNNRFCISAIAAGEIVIWDLRQLCVPVEVKKVHEDGGRALRFSPNSELTFASIGRPDSTLKVFTSKIPVIESPLKLLGNWLAWHNRLPYICAAQDRKLCFWRVPLK